MKRILLIATLLLNALTVVPALAIPTITVQRVGPELTSVGAGYRFDLFISGLSDLLGAFSLDVTFDPTVVGSPIARSRPPLGNVAASPAEADFFIDDSTPGILHIDEVSLLSSDELRGLQSIGGTLRDSFEFVRIGLTAIHEGFTNIGLANVTLSDDLGNRLADPLIIGSTLRVPEPMSLLLVSVGLLLLAGSTRQRSTTK